MYPPIRTRHPPRCRHPVCLSQVWTPTFHLSPWSLIGPRIGHHPGIASSSPQTPRPHRAELHRLFLARLGLPSFRLPSFRAQAGGGPDGTWTVPILLPKVDAFVPPSSVRSHPNSQRLLDRLCPRPRCFRHRYFQRHPLAIAPAGPPPPAAT